MEAAAEAVEVAPPDGPPQELNGNAALLQAVREANRVERETEEDETQPYKGKYAARDVLLAARQKAEGRGEARQVARLDCLIGINLYLTEENGEGERTLLRSAAALEGEENWAALENARTSAEADQGQAETATPSGAVGSPAWPAHLDLGSLVDLVNAYNYLGILWSHRAMGNRNAQFFLERAKGLAEDPRLKSAPPSSDLEAETAQAEEAYTSTLFFLAQVYTSQGKAELGAMMCAETLARQRRLNHSFEPWRWARDAIGLAAYFGLICGATRVASHCLGAALRAMPGGADDSESPVPGPDEEVRAGLVADLLRAKGALYLEILRRAAFAFASEGAPAGAWASPSAQHDLPDCYILDDCSERDEAPPSVQEITEFEGARQVFRTANLAFEKAKEHYLLDGHATDHVAILQSQSQLYKFLAYFETDLKRVVAMHSRREKLLAGLLDELNAEYYAVQHQEIAYELGDAARELLAANSQRATGDGPAKAELGGAVSASPADAKKINESALKVVRYYSHFCKSFEAADALDERSGSGPASPDEYTPFLMSKFWIAHAYIKMIPPDPTSAPARALLLQQALNKFQETLELANKRLAPDSPLFAAERGICRDLVELLPSQIQSLRLRGTTL